MKCKWDKKIGNGWFCYRPTDSHCLFPDNIRKGDLSEPCKNPVKAKPKRPRMVRVKAWGWVNPYQNCITVNTGKNKPNYKRDGVEPIPCFILIDRKYLGRK